MSARDLCRDCGADRTISAQEQLAMHEGPYYEQWRRSMVAHARSLISG